MNEEIKKEILDELNLRIGSDINNLLNAYDIENELVLRRNHLQSSLNVVSNEVPTKLYAVVEKAENNNEHIENLRIKNEVIKNKLIAYLDKTEPLRNELDKRFKVINKLKDVLLYLKSLEKVDDLSRQLKQCSDDEQAVLFYGELKAMCTTYTQGHRATYVKECTHYWHNILKDKLAKHYEDVLKQLKWPFKTGADNASPSKESLTKLNNLTKYLLLIEEPKGANSEIDAGDSEQDPCLPVRILLRPLKKRFTFHFTGSRQTARLDRPEWFLTQTLTWIKDHSDFIKRHVQPIADKLHIKGVKAEDEFNAGLIALAAERLHTVLGLYHTQSSKLSLDMDAAFAHAVDETLGFHKELCALTGKDENSVLAVLTKAETFVKWLAIEKKYALAKMDESLDNENWMEAVAAGVGAAIGAVVWVPRGADWFISLLKTIEDRYAVLPQPGHRLQFLELQLELVEEWRVRLTQLLGAALASLAEDTFLHAAGPHALVAAINAAHHTRAVLLQWAHSLHYLKLYYYRRQFEHFTQQHHDAQVLDMKDFEDPIIAPTAKTESLVVEDLDESLSLIEVETRANKLALNEISRRDSSNFGDVISGLLSPLASREFPGVGGGGATEDPGVFAEAPALLLHVRESGLSALADHVLMEFKAAIKDYKKQKWHAMSVVEEMALSVSPPLCRPLAGLCARLHSAAATLAPSLCAKLRAHLAAELDTCLYEEVILENWWNTGGTAQINHDLTRNLIPIFAAGNKPAGNPLPKLSEAVQLLAMDYEDGRRLRAGLVKRAHYGRDILQNVGVRQLPTADAVRILNQRTDLGERSPSQFMMDLYRRVPATRSSHSSAGPSV